MGVFKQGSKYRARFTRNGKTINVGSYNTKAEAQKALEKARSGDAIGSYKMGFEDTGSFDPKPRQSGPTFWQRVRAKFKR